MIHSRPGFSPRTSDQQVSKLNDDMIPAINRKPLGEKPDEPPAKLDLSNRKLKTKPIIPPPEVLKAAQLAGGPELILNPEPSATPQVLTPGK